MRGRGLPRRDRASRLTVLRGAPIVGVVAAAFLGGLVVPRPALADVPIGPDPAEAPVASDGSDAEAIGAARPQQVATRGVGVDGQGAAPVQRFIVRFDDGLTADQLTSVEAQVVDAGFEVVDRYQEVFDGVVADGSPQSAGDVAAIDGVAAVDVNSTVQLTDATVTNTQVGAPWGLDRIDQRSLPLSTTYTTARRGAGVTAYVLDTGLRSSHVDFAQRVVDGAYARSVGIDTSDCNGHGTHVSGTLVGTTYGVAKGAWVVPVRVFNCAGAAFDADILAGLEWIINEHQAGAPAVLNMSLGGAASATFDAAVRRVVDDGITVVAAAGNDGADACLDSPARIDSVITVGATDRNDSAAIFSNFGRCLDLYAPGAAILSASNLSNTGSREISGTSMAAPHVAGAAALLLGQDPTLTPQQVTDRLIAVSTVGIIPNAGPDSPNRLLHVEPTSATTFTAVTPTRLLETRTGPGLGTVDGGASGIGAAGPGSTTTLQIAGRGGVPSVGVGAVAINISVTEPTAPGFVTAHPTGVPRPNAASLTFSAGQTISNLAIVPLGPSGSVDLFNLTGTTHLIVDVLGWFPVGPNFTALAPTRILDTRSGPGLGTFDGRASGGGPVGPNSTLDLQVTGRGLVPPAGAASVVVNISVTEPTAGSFLTAYPTGAQRPNAANLTFSPGKTISNLAIVPMSSDGRISLYNLAGSTHVVVDVLGWFAASPGAGGPNFSGSSPKRILETRIGPGLGTIDGAANGVGPAQPNSTTVLPVTGRGDVPASGVAAVVVNISVSEPTTASYLTAHPTGGPRPNAANLTFPAGQTISNLAIVPVAGGRISLYNLTGYTHVIVDVLGWFPVA